VATLLGPLLEQLALLLVQLQVQLLVLSVMLLEGGSAQLVTLPVGVLVLLATLLALRLVQ
jgi:hypothetical protein